jgi:predicted 3-demethylubiquinone-9 3-methyltransferase (glyoxalase superfamily)
MAGPGSSTTGRSHFKSLQKIRVETDRYWNAIVARMADRRANAAGARIVGAFNWQITPVVLTKAFTGSDRIAAKRAFDAMMHDEKD